MSNLRDTIKLDSDLWRHIQTILHRGTAKERAWAEEIRLKRKITKREKAYIEAGQDMGCDGEVEVDADAIISEGDDTGAYVQAWMWVSQDKAGVFDEGDQVLFDPEAKNGDGNSGLDNEFVGTIKGSMKVDTNGSIYYTVGDQEDNTFDIDAKYLSLHED